MTETELRRLLDRYLDGTANAEERRMAEAFFRSYEKEAEEGHYAGISEPGVLRSEILKGLSEKYNREYKRVRMFSTLWRAAVILLLVLPAYLLYKHHAPVTKRDLAVKDIAPGNDKAILILSDNTRIELDSTEGGAIAKQGASVITNENGQLSYVNTGDPVTPEHNMIITPRGGQYSIVLADGTRVWLNAASTLRYPTSFPGDERVVELTGEAYFEVAENKRQPFRVQAGEATVEVLGTAFNIMAYTDEEAIETTLVTGTVRVSMKQHGATLRPNQQARIMSDGNLKVVEGLDVSEAIAWKDGTFVFNGTNTEVIMRRLARWYDVDIVYEGDVSSLNFGGVVSRKENVSSVIRLLELTGVIDFEVADSVIVVRPAQP